MKKIVITGGSGDIAQAARQLLEKEFIVYTPSKEELDITSTFEIKKYMEKIKPNILINNAGYIYREPIIKLNVLELKRHININLIGAAMCSKYAILNGADTIINIGSTAGCDGKADWSAYCISKAGLIMLSDCLAKENIKAITLSIGRTNTKMRKKLFPNEDESTLLKPEDIANLIKKLLLSTAYDSFWDSHNGKNIIYRKGEEICIEG